MNEMLKLIVSLSLSGSILALLLLIGTPLLKGRLSGTFSYYIWLLVLLRLVVPVTASVNLMDSLLHMEKATITSTLSEPASRQTQTNNQSATDQQTSVNIQPEGTQAPQINETAEDNSSENAREQLTLWELVQNNLFWLWLAGGASSLGWFILAYSVFSTQMRRSYVCPDDADIAVFERLRGNDRRIRLACSNGASTPMLIGLLRPTIILPMCSYVKNGKGSELYNILRHELTHHRRKDILYKWFIVIATSLHW
ncbi:MAG: M56 family metallopeptidase, partial [Lentisphaeria bacterium]